MSFFKKNHHEEISHKKIVIIKILSWAFKSHLAFHAIIFINLDYKCLNKRIYDNNAAATS